MKTINPLLIAALGFALLLPPLQAQDTDAKNPGILVGPGTGKLGTVAQIAVPEGFILLDAKTTRAMMKKMGDRVSGDELGYLRNTNSDWAVFFEFSQIGYVKEDDKDKLDAGKLLDSYKRGTAEANKDRESAGRPPIIIVGWEQEPKYDSESHNLTWCLRATSEGHAFLNYNTRLLGRKGVMKVVLVCDPEDLAKTLPAFNGLLANHKFLTGESYAEYRPGDKVAKYGLAALVLGGAAVGAAKLGLLAWVLPFLKKGWILIVAAIAAAANFFKKLFGKISGRKSDE